MQYQYEFAYIKIYLYNELILLNHMKLMIKKLLSVLFALGIFLPLSAFAELAAPTNFIATTDSPSKVVLYWTDNSIGEEGFQIEYSSDGVNFTDLSVGAGTNVTAATHMASAGAFYSYRIHAYPGPSVPEILHRNTQQRALLSLIRMLKMY